MIRLTRLNGEEVVVNAELIEMLEALPDTTITLTTGRKLVVKEGIEEVIRRYVLFKRQFIRGGRGR